MENNILDEITILIKEIEQTENSDEYVNMLNSAKLNYYFAQYDKA